MTTPTFAAGDPGHIAEHNQSYVDLAVALALAQAAETPAGAATKDAEVRAVAAADATTKANAATATAAAALTASETTASGTHATVVEHGATAATARPAGAVRVFWRGTVTPSNATVGDRYVNITTPATPVESICTSVGPVVFAALGGGASAPDASTTVKGVVQLAGALGGTAAAPTVPGLATKLDSSDVTSPSSLLSLRSGAQLASSASAILVDTVMGTFSGSTTGNTTTWGQVTGSGFTFSAPRSGRVDIAIVMGYAMPGGLATLDVRLHSLSGNPVVNTSRRMLYQPASALAAQGQMVYRARLTGLVPGDAYQFFLAVNNSASTTQPTIESGSVYGPAMVTVTSLPTPPVSDTAVLTKTGPLVLPSWAAAKAAVVAGTRDAKVLLIGDSTQRGYLTDDPATKLVPKLVARGLAAVRGGDGPSLDDASSPRYTAGAGWPSGLLYGFGSKGWQYSNPTGILDYADTGVNADRFDIYYLRGPAVGALTLTIDGETPTAVDTNGTTSIQKVTVSAATATAAHVLHVTATGSGAILMVEPWLSTTKKIRVANGAVPSTNSVTWNAGIGIYSKSMIAAYAPDVIIYLIGANDTVDPADAAVPTSVADFVANVKGVAGAYPSADFIIASPIPCQIESEYLLGRQYAAHERYELPYPLVDIGLHFGTWSQANTAGWMGDLRHPNAVGMDQMATLYDQMLGTA